MNLDYREAEALRPFNLRNDKHIDCPSCGHEKKPAYLNRSPKNNVLYWNCNRLNSCGQSGKVLDLLNDNTSYTSYTPTKNKKSVSDTTNNESPKNISRACEFIAEHGTLTKNHEARFIKKRKFEPNKNNYFSLTKDLIKSIESIDSYAHSELNRLSFYDLIILERYLDNKPKSLRLYSFTNKKHKKITLSNIESLGLYGLENIKPDTIRVIFVEGEEKADQANKNAPPGTVFISIPGIRSIGKAIEFIRNNPNYQYFILFDQENNSKAEPEAVKAFISKVQKLEEENISIKALDIPADALAESGSKKLGIDDYLVLFPEGERPAKLQSILDDSLDILVYKNKYQEFIKKEPYKGIPSNPSIGKPAKRDKIQFQSFDDVRNLLPLIIKDHIKNSTDVLEVISPTGIGKSTSIKNVAIDYKAMIVTETKELREGISDSNISEIKSIVDYCKENLKDQPEETINFHSNNVDKFLKKSGDVHNNYCKKYCPFMSTCQKFEKPKNKSVVMTHAKALQSDFKDWENYDVVFVDENMNCIKNEDIKIKELNSIIEYYNTTEGLSTIAKILKEVFNKVKKNLLEGNLLKLLSKMATAKGYNLDNLIKSLPDQPKINELKLSKLDFNNYDDLPDKSQVYGLVYALKNNLRSCEFITEEFIPVLKIGYLKELPYINIPIIYLDATADSNLTKLIFRNKIVKTYKPNIQLENTNIHFIHERTFKTGNILNNHKHKQQLEDFINDHSEYKNCLFVGSRELTQKLNLNANIQKTNYGLSKGSNQYKDCEKAFILPPKVNEQSLINKAKILSKDITNFEYKIKKVPTGHIVNGKEEYIDVKEYRDPILEALHKQEHLYPMIQASGRVKRDKDSIRDIYFFGNANFYYYYSQYGLVPKNILSLGKIKKSGKHDELRKDLKNLIENILNDQKFILKSEIQKLPEILKISENLKAETIDNTLIGKNHINIYIYLRLLPNLMILRDTVTTIEKSHFNKIVNEVIKNAGFINENLPTLTNKKEEVILKSSDDLAEAKQYYSRLEMIRPGKQLNSFSQTIGTQYLHTEIKEINCYTLPDAYNLYPTFTGYEERSFNFMSEQMLQFYKDNQLTPGNAKESLTNHLLNNFGNDTAKAEKFINRFLASMEPQDNTDVILPMESPQVEFNEPMEALTINLPRTDKNSPYYDSLNAEIIPGENNYLKKAKDTSTNVRAILTERRNQPKLEAPPIKFKFSECQNQTELEHNTIKSLGNVFEKLYFEDYTKDIKPQKELEHISSILEVLFPNNIQMLKDIPEAPLKARNFIAYAKGNWTYLLREFKPMLLKIIKEGKLLTKEGLSKRFNPDLEKIPEYSNKFYYQLFMCIQFTANMDIINKIITDKKLKNILLTSVIRFENVADLKIKYG